MHLSREQGLGARVVCSERAFLRALGRATKNVEWLRISLERLTACVVKITRQRQTYWGSLIEKGYRDEETGELARAERVDIKALLGHESISTTQIDTHVGQARMAAVVNRL